VPPAVHELAITESIVAGVAERVDGRRVTRVVLEIGRLSGVVPEAVCFCFARSGEGLAEWYDLLRRRMPAGG